LDKICLDQCVRSRLYVKSKNYSLKQQVGDKNLSDQSDLKDLLYNIIIGTIIGRASGGTRPGPKAFGAQQLEGAATHVKK